MASPTLALACELIARRSLTPDDAGWSARPCRDWRCLCMGLLRFIAPPARETAGHHLLVAAAGPAVTLLILLAASSAESALPRGVPLLRELAHYNVIIAAYALVINLLPVQSSDTSSDGAQMLAAYRALRER